MGRMPRRGVGRASFSHRCIIKQAAPHRLAGRGCTDAVSRQGALAASLSSANLCRGTDFLVPIINILYNRTYPFEFFTGDRCLCGADPEANYITFRFKGGGGSFENRLLRIRLIQIILEWAGFVVHTRGDLLEARFQRREAGRTLSRLTLLGLLQGKTRLLDMALGSPEQVRRMAEDYKERYQEYVSEA